MQTLTAAATGALGIVTGLELGGPGGVSLGPRPTRAAASVVAAALAVTAALLGRRSRARLPLATAAALAVASSAAALDSLRPRRRVPEVVSGETQLIRLYRRDARMSGVRSALQIGALGALLFAAALDAPLQ
jgi:hypothetical protein